MGRKKRPHRPFASEKKEALKAYNSNGSWFSQNIENQAREDNGENESDGIENNCSGQSASFRKLSANLDKMNSTSEPTVAGYRLFDLEILQEQLDTLLCSHCKEGSMTLYENTSERSGWASSMTLKCTNPHCEGPELKFNT